MKTSKNTKTILGLIMIVAIAISGIIMIMNMVGWPWFYFFFQEAGQIRVLIDWAYGGVLLGLLFLALVLFVVRTCLYTCHSKSASVKVMEALIGLGLLICIISFFLPMNVVFPGDIDSMEAVETAYMIPQINAAFVMVWVGAPMTLVSSIAVAFYNRHQHAAA